MKFIGVTDYLGLSQSILKHIDKINPEYRCILVDEMQNLNFHELDSVITRIGKDCRVIFCGDYMQSDFKFDDEKDGIIKFMKIVEQMRFFDVVKFGWEDIVRSDLVRDYIMTKEMLGIS